MDTRQQAQELIAAGRVTVDGAPAFKAARQVASGQAVLVAGPPPRFVSRAGHKLEAALAEFGVDPQGRHGLDIGSSTGGFTDCLLQEGALSVVAVDVGTNQLHERLRGDARVRSMENTHIRAVSLPDLAAEDAGLAEGFGVVVADLSFISTTGLLPLMAGFLAEDGDLLVLSHNGPAGLGDRADSIWGCDFREEEGDWGDPDLTQAIDHARAQGKRVLAVIGGHMHLRTKQGVERPWRTERDGTLYLNAARVPRIFSRVFWAGPRLSLSALVSRMCTGMWAASAHSSIWRSKGCRGWRTSISRIMPRRHCRLAR